MLFFKMSERRLFFVGSEPFLALLTASTCTLAEVTEYHSSGHGIMRERAANKQTVLMK
jgi:hypothetical protein